MYVVLPPPLFLSIGLLLSPAILGESENGERDFFLLEKVIVNVDYTLFFSSDQPIRPRSALREFPSGYGSPFAYSPKNLKLKIDLNLCCIIRNFLGGPFFHKGSAYGRDLLLQE